MVSRGRFGRGLGVDLLGRTLALTSPLAFCFGFRLFFHFASTLFECVLVLSDRYSPKGELVRVARLMRLASSDHTQLATCRFRFRC